MRQEIGDILSKTLSQVGYHNAGTIEFLMDQQLRLYFIEMNTRIQVEHPVTEMVTEVVLVKRQIMIATGEKMAAPLQAPIVHPGHAIEFRIKAEQPANFPPSSSKMN